jgi:hypothetical protein
MWTGISSIDEILWQGAIILIGGVKSHEEAYDFIGWKKVEV